MLKSERQQLILERIDTYGRVVVTELTKELGLTNDTIRKDLQELSKAGLLKRVHGGAMKIDSSIPAFDVRIQRDLPSKQILARKALPLLQENKVIYFDSGTTNLELASILPLDFRADIITNSPTIALKLSNHEHLNIYVVPGFLNKSSHFLCGSTTVEAISQINIDLCILGISAIDLERGISVPTLEEAQVKRAVIKQSDRIISLVTKDKLETISSHYIDDITVIETIITTNDISDSIKKSYESKNIEMIVDAL